MQRPPRLTAVDRVERGLRRAITTGTLEPGAHLREEELAKKYGVSRTPVREALRHLRGDGLIVILPNVGAQVAGFSLVDIDELFEIRGALEVLAAQRAATRITPAAVKKLRLQLERTEAASRRANIERLAEENTRLHDAIYELAGSPQLVRLIESLSEKLARFRVASLSSPDRPREALAEHRALVTAITRRDVEKVRELAISHAEKARLAATRWYLDRDRASTRRVLGGVS